LTSLVALGAGADTILPADCLAVFFFYSGIPFLPDISRFLSLTLLAPQQENIVLFILLL